MKTFDGLGDRVSKFALQHPREIGAVYGGTKGVFVVHTLMTNLDLMTNPSSAYIAVIPVIAGVVLGSRTRDVFEVTGLDKIDPENVLCEVVERAKEAARYTKSVIGESIEIVKDPRNARRNLNNLGNRAVILLHGSSQLLCRYYPL